MNIEGVNDRLKWSAPALPAYFLAKLIFMAVVGVILNPWSASLAAADCISDSNSTNAMS